MEFYRHFKADGNIGIVGKILLRTPNCIESYHFIGLSCENKEPNVMILNDIKISIQYKISECIHDVFVI